MKKIAICGLISIIFIHSAYSQEEKIKSPNLKSLGINFAFSVAEFHDINVYTFGAEFLKPLGKHLKVGINGNFISPFNSLLLQSSDEVNLLGFNGGLIIEPIINPGGKISLSFPLNFGGGWLNYSGNAGFLNQEQVRKSDFHWYALPRISFNYHFNEDWSLGFFYGYRVARKISLTGINEDAFDGQNLGITIRKAKLF